MIMAGIGLILLIFNLARGKNAQINRDFLMLSAWAVTISLFGFISITINGTTDYTYTTYIISMWVWMGGAYTATRLMKWIHGYLSVQLICHYLIAVCVAQCIIAFSIGQLPIIKSFVDSFLAGEGFMGRAEDRLYGIGASLDVGGMRFAAILLIISNLCLNMSKRIQWFQMLCYISSFIVIVLVGNMIGRTTIVGAVMAIAYWIYVCIKGNYQQRINLRFASLIMCFSLIVFLPIIICLYQTNLAIHDNIRFAFEGFFSIVEKGHWEMHSNEILKNMYVFPDNLKTWIFGDGYMENPYHTDPYYTGPHWNGYYQGTDVGYLRFIFYFGISGLLPFIIYMCNAARICIRRFKAYRNMFLAILFLNFIVWFKVSSDLFLVFAIFLCPTIDEEAKTLDFEEKTVNENRNYP